MKPLKIKITVIILAILAAAVSTNCSSTRKFLETDVVTDTEELSHPVNDGSLESLGVVFNKAVASGDIAVLAPFIPDASAARAIAPEETGSLQDDDIRKMMLEPMNERLKANVRKVHEEALAKGISIDKLVFKGAKEQPADNEDQPVAVATISLKAPGWTTDIPVTYMVHEKRIYLFEVLFSTNVFKPVE